MPSTDRSENPDADAARRAGERPAAGAAGPSTGFGPTLFDNLAPSVADAARQAAVFDVCHAGVVLRALLFVHAVLAIGVAFAAPTLDAWIARLVAATVVALPALALWLLLACGLRRLFGVLPVPARAAAAMALGAGCAAVIALGVAPTMANLLPGGIGAQPVLAPALAGAGFAAGIFLWLQWRAQALLPADTTARLAELQSRIRPHFLFNTLNTALALVRVDPARAEGVLEDLAELFRFALADHADGAGAAASVSLDEEVELAQRYLAIEQIRFGDRLKVSWELDPAAGAARVPPLLLQPLVENAVRHGVEPSDAGGTIRVRTRLRLGRAVVSIANTVPDGPSRPGTGMALKNVRERLRLMHDLAAQFETQHDKNVFRVQLVVPL